MGECGSHRSAYFLPAPPCPAAPALLAYRQRHAPSVSAPGIAEKVLSLAASFATLLADFFKALWETGGVIQTILSVLFLLAIYALCYWLYLVVGKRRFISIAPFRVWGSSPPQYPGEGIAARLGDELLKLQREMRESYPKGETEGVSFYATHFELPSIAQVTVEYGGFSPELFNSFLRRLFRRQVVISGDMIPSESGLLLVGRSSGVGPWEVQAERSDVSTLHRLLQEIAVRAVADLHPKTKLAIGNALASRQRKAAAAQNRDESLRHARLATMALPKVGTSFNNLGAALDDKGRFDDAITALNKALQLKPDFPEALYNLGNVLAHKPQFDEAIAAYHKALQLKPDFPQALSNLGSALFRKGQFDEAIAAYHKALRLKPHDPQALTNLGSALYRQVRFEEGSGAINKALQLKPDNPEALNNLGSALARKDRFDEAIAAFHKALQLKPDFPQALNNLGSALARKDRFDEAIAALNKAVQLEPDNPSLYYNLGRILRKAGKEEEARRAFAKAQRLDPKFKPPEPQ